MGNDFCPDRISAVAEGGDNFDSSETSVTMRLAKAVQSLLRVCAKLRWRKL
jgi:hypothetical protein